MHFNDAYMRHQGFNVLMPSADQLLIENIHVSAYLNAPLNYRSIYLEYLNKKWQHYSGRKSQDNAYGKRECKGT